MALEIVPATTDVGLPACTPSLMPFHISYTGPAPVSRYLRPRPAPPSLAALSVQSSSTTTVVASSSSTSILSDTKSSLTMFSSTTSVGSVAHESQHPRLSKPGSSIEALNQVDQARPALVVDTTMETNSETQPTLGSDDISRRSRIHTSMSSNVERFIAAFRGRQMYGQAVDVPNGYGGLVLRAPLDSKRKGEEEAKASSKPLSREAKPKSGKTRVTTRRPRHATPDEPEGGDEDDYCPNSDADPLSVTRKLIPCSTFSSFMLWAPDRPLDEGSDEYVRALVEWTRLATEIHSYDG